MANVTISKTATDKQPGLYGYKLAVEAVSSTGMEKEIFVMKETTNESRRDFVSIADPLDLEEFNVNAPYASKGQPYYRVNKIELVFRSAVEMDETWAYIKDDITKLMEAINNNLTTTEEVVFG